MRDLLREWGSRLRYSGALIFTILITDLLGVSERGDRAHKVVVIAAVLLINWAMLSYLLERHHDKLRTVVRDLANTRGATARRFASGAAVQLTDLAVFIGGQRRAGRRDEWTGILHEARANGRFGLAQLRHSSGFVVAAMKMRAADAATVGGRTLNWVLAKPRLEYLAGIVAVATAVYIFQVGGFDDLIRNLGSVASAAAIVAGAGLFLRAHRHVPPARGKRVSTPRRK